MSAAPVAAIVRLYREKGASDKENGYQMNTNPTMIQILYRDTRLIRYRGVLKFGDMYLEYVFEHTLSFNLCYYISMKASADAFVIFSKAKQRKENRMLQIQMDLIES